MPKKRIARKATDLREDIADAAEQAPLEALPIKALYKVGDLAKALQVPWRKLKRLLDLHEVFFYRVGRLWLVPLSEIEHKVPPLFDWIRKGRRPPRGLRALDDE